MSGVETAGLVLGSIPLLVLAVEKWHKGFVKTRDIAGLRPKDRERIATKINGLAAALKWHNSQLNINLKCLLKASDPALDLDTLPRDYRDQLWKGPLGDSLNDYLRRAGGEEVIEAFRGEIEASKALVEEIGQHFRQGKEKAQALKGGLREVCDILSRRSKRLGFKERFGFTLHEKDIDRLTKDLGHLSSSIASFVASLTNLDKLPGQPSGDKSADGMRKIVNRLYKTRDHALALFNTMKRGWVADCQHRMHNALLHLQSDCHSTSPLSQGDQEFHMLFQILSEEGNANALWKELAVIMDTDSLNLPQEPTRAPLVTIQEDSDQPDPRDEVTDICRHISLSRTNEDIICFSISDNDRLYYAQNRASSSYGQTAKRKKILPKGPSLVPLQTYLTTNCRKLLDKKRIELAIKLGCSILQFNCTPWIARGLRKEHIYFFSDQTKESLIDVDHPLIVESFPCTTSTCTVAAPTPQDTLLDFAILLLELYHRQTFETWVENLKSRDPKLSLASLDDPDWKRMFAMKWAAEMQRQADFWDMVNICLWPHQLRQNGEESWEDQEWRLAFYKFIISPLRGQ